MAPSEGAPGAAGTGGAGSGRAGTGPEPSSAGQADASQGFLAVVLEDALAANGISAWPVDGFPGVMAGVGSGRFGEWNLFARADEEARGVVVHSVFPGNVPDNRRLAVAELATRGNYLLRYGNIEMDFTDGEVRCRTSARGGPEPLDFNVISELVVTNLEVADLFFPAVKLVAVEGVGPATALAGLLQNLH